MKALVSFGPRLQGWMLVRGVTVHDQVQLQILGRFVVDLLQKRQPLLMPVLRFETADQPALRIAQGGKQRERAIPDIVMGLRADVADTQWRPGWVRSKACTWLFSSQHRFTLPKTCQWTNSDGTLSSYGGASQRRLRRLCRLSSGRRSYKIFLKAFKHADVHAK